jgi:hypothetical protein
MRIRRYRPDWPCVLPTAAPPFFPSRQSFGMSVRLAYLVTSHLAASLDALAALAFVVVDLSTGSVAAIPEVVVAAVPPMAVPAAPLVLVFELAPSEAPEVVASLAPVEFFGMALVPPLLVPAGMVALAVEALGAFLSRLSPRAKAVLLMAKTDAAMKTGASLRMVVLLGSWVDLDAAMP